MAHDQGYPMEKTDEATLNVRIQRTVSKPVFTQPTYRFELSEATQVNRSIGRIAATLPTGVSVYRPFTATSLDLFVLVVWGEPSHICLCAWNMRPR